MRSLPIRNGLDQLNCAARADGSVLARGEPPGVVAADEDIERHFGERAVGLRGRFDGLAGGVEGVARDVRDDVLVDRENVFDLVARGRSSDALLLQSFVNGVEPIESVSCCAVRASPRHVAVRLPHTIRENRLRIIARPMASRTDSQ
jgi:hypothetical protein